MCGVAKISIRGYEEIKKGEHKVTLFETGKELVVLGDGPDKRIKNGTLNRSLGVYK